MSGPLERRLTLHQLRVFRTVVDEGGVTRGAEALALTQSAVTHQLQTLARGVGQPLLQPSRRRLALTPAGELIYECAGRALAVVYETGEMLQELAGLTRGTVRVVGDSTIGIYVLPDALAAFHRLHPEIRLTLEVVNRSQVRESLLVGSADIGVAGKLWDDDLLINEPFLENELVCVSSPDHPLVAREPVRLADLLQGPLLLREPGSGTRETAESILRQAGLEPAPAMQLASNGALKRMVAGGLGVSILSTYAVRLELESGHLHQLQVEGFPVKRVWHMIWSRDRALSPAVHAFREHLRGQDWRGALGVPLGAE
ncbi:MAG: LysR family transcriptional regulator [Candidatus Dormiibacterota bacterium]